MPSCRTQPCVPSPWRPAFWAGASLGVCSGGWGYGPLGSQENRASGLGSLCKMGRSQWVSALVRSGEESMGDWEAGGRQRQLPLLWCLRRRVKFLPLLWWEEGSGGRDGPEVPWARVFHETGGVCGGEGTLTTARGHWAPEEHGGQPPAPPGEVDTLLAECSLCVALGWELSTQAWIVPSRVRNSPCQPHALPVPDLEDILQFQWAGVGRAQHQDLQHAVHGIQGLQGGCRICLRSLSAPGD